MTVFMVMTNVLRLLSRPRNFQVTVMSVQCLSL